MRGIVRGQRLEDVINGFKRCTHHTFLLWHHLRHQQEIIHVDVHRRDWWLTRGTTLEQT